MEHGLEFFPPDTPDAVRRRRWIFLAVSILAGSMVIWPLFPWLGARQALVFGLPASIVWVVSALAVQFAALLWLYAGEQDTGEDDAEEDDVAGPEPQSGAR